MSESISIKITSKKLNLQDCYNFVQDASCGGIALFVGTVRNKTQNKEVTLLDFSTYEEMALREIEKIAERALEQFDVLKIAIHHAKGAFRDWANSCNYFSIFSTQKSLF